MGNKQDNSGYSSESIISEVFLKNINGYRKYLTKFLHSNHDIEDVIQEAYLRIQKVERSTEVKLPKSFLFKIVRNLALTAISRNAKQMARHIEDIDESEVIDDKACPERKLIAHQELRAFYEVVISALPPQCRRVFVMRKAYGYTHKEIAKKLGISVSTVEKHLINGIKRYEQYVQTAEGTSLEDKETGRQFRTRSIR